MIYKWKEVPDNDCPCCNHTKVKEAVIQQPQCTLIKRVRIFKEIMDSLKQRMKGHETERTMGAILFWYI